MLFDLASSKLEIWFTSGWVRDVALSTVTGMQFGRALKDFFARNGAKYKQEAQKLGVPPDQVREQI
jgi:hypothetical protein